MIELPRRVIKLGGSLLDWPELAPRFRRWLADQSAAVNVVIVGGGVIVDAVRQFDRDQRLSPEAAHWLSIRGMGLTAALAGEMLPEAVCVRNLNELRFSPTAGLQILEVESFLREDQNSPDALPCGWHVTSDSIAARVATVLEARELVLLKSALPADTAGTGFKTVGDCPDFAESSEQNRTVPLSADRFETCLGRTILAQCGLIDSYFPSASKSLRVRIVNLRDPAFAELAIQPNREPSCHAALADNRRAERC